MTLPESNTETMTQHPAEVEGFVRTSSFNCVGDRAESGLLMLFGGGRKRKRKMEVMCGAHARAPCPIGRALNPGGADTVTEITR